MPSRSPVADASDEALVRAAGVGDQDAFAVLVGRYGPGMYRYALRLVGEENDADEIAQEAFVSAWRGLRTFAGRSSLKTWLYRLVHRRAVDTQRHRRPSPVSDDVLSTLTPAASDDPLQQVLDEELLIALQAVLHELPWQQRATWLLREVEDMTYEEIAETVALSVGSVRGHLYRARRTVAERMAQWR